MRNLLDSSENRVTNSLCTQKKKWNVNKGLYAGALEGSTVVPEMSSAANGASESP